MKAIIKWNRCCLRKCLEFKVQVNRSFCSGSKISEGENAQDLPPGLDEGQVKLLSEPCILVDKHDRKIGTASKKTCHLLENINNGMLHRAFSVFLFNKKGELLLQQRSDKKITFPGLFTNTCCSHPLNFELETEEKEAMGVRRAAQRKLHHELGITPDQVPLDTLHYITRIQYKADNVPADGKFGESEIDYCLIVQKDVDINHNPDEVKSYQFVKKQHLQKLLENEAEGEMKFTPWFRLISQRFLFKWWNNLDKMKTLQDHKIIHKLS